MVEKFVAEYPEEHGVPGLVAPFTRTSGVPVAFAATTFNAPEESLVYDNIWPLDTPTAAKMINVNKKTILPTAEKCFITYRG